MHIPADSWAPNRPLHLPMDRADEGNETRQLTLELGFIPVVRPLRTRVKQREYDTRRVQAPQ